MQQVIMMMMMMMMRAGCHEGRVYNLCVTDRLLAIDGQSVTHKLWTRLS